MRRAYRLIPLPPAVLDTAFSRWHAGEPLAAVSLAMRISFARMKREMRRRFGNRYKSMRRYRIRRRTAAAIIARTGCATPLPEAPVFRRRPPIIPDNVIAAACPRWVKGETMNRLAIELHTSTDRLARIFRDVLGPDRYADVAAIRFRANGGRTHVYRDDPATVDASVAELRAAKVAGKRPAPAAVALADPPHLSEGRRRAARFAEGLRGVA